MLFNVDTIRSSLCDKMDRQQLFSIIMTIIIGSCCSMFINAKLFGATARRQFMKWMVVGSKRST